jgi:hypothetical protein
MFIALVSLLENYGFAEKWVFTLSVWATLVSCSWFGSLLFYAVDKYRLLSFWKIQKGKFADEALVAEAFKQLTGDSITTPITLYFSYVYFLDGKVRFGADAEDAWDVFFVKFALAMVSYVIIYRPFFLFFFFY